MTAYLQIGLIYAVGAFGCGEIGDAHCGIHAESRAAPEVRHAEPISLVYADAVTPRIPGRECGVKTVKREPIS